MDHDPMLLMNEQGGKAMLHTFNTALGVCRRRPGSVQVKPFEEANRPRERPVISIVMIVLTGRKICLILHEWESWPAGPYADPIAVTASSIHRCLRIPSSGHHSG